jgi:hypothetical protein
VKQSVGGPGKNDGAGQAGELAKAHVLACEGRAGEMDALFEDHVKSGRPDEGTLVI